jgi:hypothetical protein
MAQTLKIQASISNETDGGFAGSRSFTVTTTGDGSWMKRASVSHTAEEEWVIDAEIGDAGYCEIRNFDSTNYLRVGFATGDYKIRVKAGQCATIPLEPSVSSLFFIANTAAVVAQAYVVEA